MKYRPLMPGEIIQEGDQIGYDGNWQSVRFTVGEIVQFENRFRRPVKMIPILFKRERETVWMRISNIVRRIFWS